MDQVRAGDQGDLPGRPVRSVVLPQADAGRLRDALEVPEEGHFVRVQWAHRHDLLVDVRLTPADWTNLQDSDDDGPHLAADGRLVVGDSRYELTVGWPRRDAGTECRYCPADVLAARVADRIAADSQVDAVRGYDGTEDDGHADPHFTHGRCVCTCPRCVTRMDVPGEDDAPVCTCPDGCTCDDGIHGGAS